MLMCLYMKRVIFACVGPSGSRIAHPVQRKFEASSMHEEPQVAAQAQMVDDGSGQKEIWR